jgi:hypothetical protein
VTIQREANMTPGISESIFPWLSLVGAAVPPDPDDDEDEDDEEDALTAQCGAAIIASSWSEHVQRSVSPNHNSASVTRLPVTRCRVLEGSTHVTPPKFWH